MTRLAYNIVYSIADLKVQAERCGCPYFDSDKLMGTRGVFFVPSYLDMERTGGGSLGLYVERAMIWGTDHPTFFVKRFTMSLIDGKWTMAHQRLGEYKSVKAAKNALKEFK